MRLIKAKFALTKAEILAERDAVIAATRNEEVKAAAVDAAEAKIRAARAASDGDLAEATKKQKDALKTVADGYKEVEAAAQSAITTQVGGAKSPIFSDPTQGFGIDLGNVTLGSFGLGDVKKQPRTAFSSWPERYGARTRPPRLWTWAAIASRSKRGSCRVPCWRQVGPPAIRTGSSAILERRPPTWSGAKKDPLRERLPGRPTDNGGTDLLG